MNSPNNCLAEPIMCINLYGSFLRAGVGFAKRAEDGNYLPSARYVSLGIHKDSDRPHEHLMALTALWGEFVAHDISHTPQSSGFAGSSIKCCGIDIQNVHEDCYRIRINNKDPVYGNKFGGDGCQEYVRSAVAPRIGCTLGTLSLKP